MELLKHTFDYDIVISCNCAESVCIDYTRVKRSVEGIETKSMGMCTASMVYQNILNEGGLASLNTLRIR